MTTISINMKQFRSNWKDYTDNIKQGETIRLNKGKFQTLNADCYIHWLNEFGIFYTLK